MNKTAELVNQWVAFEAEHPDSDLQDFFRYQLIMERENENGQKFLGGIVPPMPDQILAKVMGRIIKLYMLYANKLLKDEDLGSFDEFLYLNNIENLEKPKKIDVINANFNELSSGLLILERLKKKNLLADSPDPDDKRSRLISLTTEGKEKLYNCYKLLGKLNQVIFKEMKADDILLCIKLLKPIEIKFSNQAISDKKLNFDEVYKREIEEE
ncbi:MAG: winged helix DNA-binding protein [Bacteroidetes bacterium]|nr:winged helix DNA-binding protein [Bacteroidota bacterium]MCB0844782.1 winged helix DNA-binding protein [Bacteroidota bacterium]